MPTLVAARACARESGWQLGGVLHQYVLGAESGRNRVKATRKRRVAAGAGVQVQKVNRPLNQFEQIKNDEADEKRAEWRR